MAANLPINSLVYDDIRAALVAYLKGNPTYKDFNFDGAGISTLLNVLAYQGHQLGYYVTMMANESYVDSAKTIPAMYALAKNTGYVPGSKKSAVATVILKVTVAVGSEPLSHTIHVPRGSSFQSQNVTQDQRLFQVVDDVLINSRDTTSVPGFVVYTSPNINISEGGYETWKFLVDTSQFNQQFVIRDPDIDVSTIRVEVLDSSSSSNSTPFQLATDSQVDGTSKVFWITTNSEGYYQLVFGNGIFGTALSNGNVIQVEYVSTNGVDGNGAKTFTYNAPPPDPGNDYNIGNFSNFAVTTVNTSAGGMDRETVDDMRFNIPNAFKAQNRTITTPDFQNMLISNFRNIDSLSVWGGEENTTREYGKIFVSIKPKFSDQLTGSAQDTIANALRSQFGVVGGDIQFVDPDYIDVNVNVYATVNLQLTTRSLGEIEALFLQRSSTYNSTNLNKFNQILSDVAYLDFLKDNEDEVVSVYTTKTMQKTTSILYGTTAQLVETFGNPIVPGTVSSGTFNYGGSVCYYKDELDGNVYIYSTSISARFVTAPQGTMDYTNGVIKYTFPTTAKTTGFLTSTTGNLTWTVTPQIPDIKTYLNNIVRIASTEIIISTQ